MSNKKTTFGIVLVIIGLLLLLRSLDIIYFTFGSLTRNLMPVALIVLGVWLIMRKRKQEEQIRATYRAESKAQFGSSAQQTTYTSSTAHHHKDTAFTHSPRPDEFVSPDATFTSQSYSYHQQWNDKIRFSKGFGDLSINCNNMNLHNVEISIGFGDVEINLHGGKLSEGLNRLIISGFLGDIRILVPKEMEVFVHASNFLGDLVILDRRSDGFGNNLDVQTVNYNEASNKLYIAANCFLGDIKVIVV